MFGPQRVDITDGNRAFVDFTFFGQNFNLLFSFRLLFFLFVFCVLVDVLYDNVVIFNSLSSMVSYSCGAFAFGQENFNRHEGGIFRTSRTRYSFANSRQSRSGTE